MNWEAVAICCTVILSTITATWMMSSELSSLKINQQVSLQRAEKVLSSLESLENIQVAHEVRLAVLEERTNKGVVHRHETEELEVVDSGGLPPNDDPWRLWYAGFRVIRDEHDGNYGTDFF